MCVVDEMRKWCKYVVYKEKKEFRGDMKNMYNGGKKEVGGREVENLEKKWGGKYGYGIV